MNIRSREYVLFMCTAIYSVNLLDRGLMMLLLQPIKTELFLSDTQLGLLTGIAFALFYAVLGIPISRLADRGDRAKIAAGAMFAWSIAVMMTSFVGNFFQILVARIAAAVGEAGCKPPTYSLVGDFYQRPAERSRAISVYFAGGPTSAFVAFIGGGFVAEHFGWRMAFVLIGIPGLLLSILTLATLRDPRRLVSFEAPPAPPMTHVARQIWKNRSTRHLCLAVILLYTITMGFSPWYAAFMVRSHAMRISEVGVYLAVIAGLGGVIGTLAGGFVAGRWFADSARAQMRMNAIVVALLLPCSLLVLLAPQKWVMLAGLVPLFLAFNASFGPTYALLQRLVPDSMRATTLSVVMLFANLIGMGIGPQIVGVLSDVLRPSLASDSLRFAMIFLSGIAVWSGYHFWASAATIDQDLDERTRQSEALKTSVPLNLRETPGPA